MQQKIAAKDYGELREFTKQWDLDFRKAVLGKARKAMPKGPDRDRAVLVANAVTFDLIGINKAIRNIGNEDDAEARRWFDTLVDDIRDYLTLEPKGPRPPPEGQASDNCYGARLVRGASSKFPSVLQCLALSSKKRRVRTRDDVAASLPRFSSCYLTPPSWFAGLPPAALLAGAPQNPLVLDLSHASLRRGHPESSLNHGASRGEDPEHPRAAPKDRGCSPARRRRVADGLRAARRRGRRRAA